MKKILIILLTLSAQAYASLPYTNEMITNKEEILNIVNGYHIELVDPRCVQKFVTSDQFVQGDIATGFNINSLHIVRRFDPYQNKNIASVGIYLKNKNLSSLTTLTTVHHANCLMK